jgi:hypothetical protein
MPAAVPSAARPCPPALIPFYRLVCALGLSTLAPAHQPRVSLAAVVRCGAAVVCVRGDGSTAPAGCAPTCFDQVRAADVWWGTCWFRSQSLFCHALLAQRTVGVLGRCVLGGCVFPLMGHAGPLFACARIFWRDNRRYIAKNQCPLLGGACCVDACELLTLIRTHPAFPLCGLSGDPTDAAFPGCRCVAGVACALLIFVAKSWSFGAVGKTADIC